jgi:uncharacterized protein (DUF1800 family)
MTILQGPWAPYQPTPKDPWDLDKAAHLHRRAGFGGTWAELIRDVRDGPAASANRLLKPTSRTPAEQEVLEALRAGIGADAERLKAWWLYRILYDPDPLREKLTLFWHSHFATSNRKVENVPLMLQQNELLRHHALGNFGDLLTKIISDGAMLVWLDGAESKKEKPNENFAREFLELFALGAGHYTETDVRQAARAFTGWTRERDENVPAFFDKSRVFHFSPAEFDNGSKTFLKETGPWQAADIVRIILEQPACALLICRKLYRYLVNEDEEPSTSLLAPLAEELRSSRYSIGHVVEIMLRSRHFYSRAARRARIKSPVEFSAGLVRTLAISPSAGLVVLPLAVACERQGQELFYPPNVKGWDGGKSWLNSTTVLERSNWVSDIVWGNPDLGLNPFDPLAWAKEQGLEPGRAAAAFADLLLQGDLAPEARTLGLTAGRDGTPDGLRKALQLLANCPEYQLA